MQEALIGRQVDGRAQQIERRHGAGHDGGRIEGEALVQRRHREHGDVESQRPRTRVLRRWSCGFEAAQPPGEAAEVGMARGDQDHPGGRHARRSFGIARGVEARKGLLQKPAGSRVVACDQQPGLVVVAPAGSGARRGHLRVRQRHREQA
ncbi:MAG: hypothetical protein ABI364_07525 [Caldimonas sp.]